MRISLSIIVTALFLAACSGSGDVYYFSLPVEMKLIDNSMICDEEDDQGNPVLSYGAFVLDNTDQGAVLHRINGCDGTVDSGFSDSNRATGVPDVKYGISVAAVVPNTEEILAYDASSFAVLPLETEYLAGIVLPAAKMMVYKRFSLSLTYAGSAADPANRLVRFSFYPLSVTLFAGKFLVVGTDYRDKTYLSLVDPGKEDAPEEKAQTVLLKSVLCGPAVCAGIDSGTGILYWFDSSLSPVPVDSSVFGVTDPRFTGMSLLDESQIALWNDTTVFIVSVADAQLTLVTTFPTGPVRQIQSARKITYPASVTGELFTSASYDERVTLPLPGSDTDTAAGTGSDSDTASDGEQINADTEIQDTDIPVLSALTDLTDDSDVENTDEEDPDIDSAPPVNEELFDLSKTDMVWFASLDGTIPAYAIAYGGWALYPTRDDQGVIVPRPIGPAITDYITVVTDENISPPIISRFDAIRGLAFSTQYSFSYETFFPHSLSTAGRLSLSTTTDNHIYLTDATKDFNYILPLTDRVFITAKGDDDCELPFPMAMVVTAVINTNTIELAPPDSYSAQQVIACYYEQETPWNGVDYGIYPQAQYVVQYYDRQGNIRQSRATEFPVDGPPAPEDRSYSDFLVDTVIQKTEDTPTPRGTELIIQLSPVNVYMGPGLLPDIVNSMEQVSSGNVLLFSRFQRRVLEIYPGTGEVVRSYQ